MGEAVQGIMAWVPLKVVSPQPAGPWFPGLESQPLHVACSRRRAGARSPLSLMEGILGRHRQTVPTAMPVTGLVAAVATHGLHGGTHGAWSRRPTA